ncbi:MAG: P-loop NTPase fold protein [Anaerolineales bacterium]|nr:P-loop NTPase fold protein [Anaerolineales bacterium]
MNNNIRAGQKSSNIHEPITSAIEDIEKRDILNRRILATRILKRLSEDDCPGVIGIYGGWGTGKTSLINILSNRNKQTNPARMPILEIDAWKYESSDGLLIPIIVELRKLTGNVDLPDVWKIIAKRALVTTVLTVADGLLCSVGAVGPLKIMETYDKLSEKDETHSYIEVLERWERQSDEIKETEKAFQKVIDLAMEKRGATRIIICVDNLDRCSPENVIKLLESVKVFFSAKDLIWLFAMDSDVVARYINKRYEGTGVDGYSYLDKIIPEQYHLSLSPFTDQKGIEELLRCAVGEGSHYQIDPAKVPQIPKVLVPRRLIKSARKFSDFYRGSYTARGVSPEIVMALSMLYHTWPDFYQRLSSASHEHIRGMLDNFFQHESADTAKASDSQKKKIPLDESFLRDQELVYFIRSAFSGYNVDPSEGYVIDIVDGLAGLREGGLP